MGQHKDIRTWVRVWTLPFWSSPLQQMDTADPEAAPSPVAVLALAWWGWSFWVTPGRGPH